MQCTYGRRQKFGFFDIWHTVRCPGSSQSSAASLILLPVNGPPHSQWWSVPEYFRICGHAPRSIEPGFPEGVSNPMCRTVRVSCCDATSDAFNTS